MSDEDCGKGNLVQVGHKYDAMFKPVSTLILALIFVACLLPQVHAGSTLVNIRQIDYGAYPCNSQYPVLSTSGKKVAFESNCDWASNNASSNNEIFVMEIDGLNPVQVTSGRDSAPSCNVALDASGKRLAFMSFADLIPGQNEDRNSDIFRAYADGKGLMQLTKTDGGVDVGGGNKLAHCCPAIDYAGRTIVFVSPFDPTNENEFLEHNELWIVNWDGSGLKRLTNTFFGQSSGAPVFDAAGRVYFVSGANWTGENPDGWGEIFRIDPQTGEVEQLSHIPGDSGPDGSGRMGVSASGLKVIFPMATSNLSGRPHMELFLLDTKTGEIAQLTLTGTERGCFTASMSASGKMVAYTCEVPNQPQGGNYRVFIADVD